MEIVYDAEKLKKLYGARCSKFRYLKDYLYVCGFICDVLPIKEAIDLVDSFPPKEKQFDTFLKETYGEKSLNRDKQMELSELVLIDLNQKFKSGQFSDIVHAFMIGGDYALKNTTLNDSQSFAKLSAYCAILSWLYKGVMTYDVLLKDISTIKQIDDLGFLTISKGNELLGYWTAKMEVRKQKRKNKLKGSKVSKNKNIIRKLYEEYDRKNCLAFRIEAQKKTNRGERTVSNLIKQIIAEDKK